VERELASLARDLRVYIESFDGTAPVSARPASNPAVRAGRPGAPAPESLEALRAEVLECTRCGLHRSRTNTVFGEGSGAAGIMFIGEAPGRDEDLQGRPFVGKAGQLLTRILQAMGLAREQVFIGNVLKCRPPENRDPSPEECVACLPVLRRQVELIRPKFICALGRISGSILLGGPPRSLASMRGVLHRSSFGEEVRVVVTYHPAACLRNEEYKRPVWEDMKMMMREYERAKS
jgi:uracil-DNA glycosylase family 4